MSNIEARMDAVLKAAITEVKLRHISVFTFAFYHDHESDAVSVCVDTEENSDHFVRSQNRYNFRHFRKAIADGDLQRAALWDANIGRSLSLGDFVLVNLARTRIENSLIDGQFHLSMVRALLAVQDEVAQLSKDRERLLLVCSSADDEVGFIWSVAGQD